MKYFFLITFFSFSLFNLFSQVTSKIEHLVVNDVIYLKGEAEIGDNGPELITTFVIKNNADSVLALGLYKSYKDEGNIQRAVVDFRYLFRYEGKDYNVTTNDMFWDLEAVIFGEDTLTSVPDIVELHPGERISLVARVYILETTPMFPGIDGNYTRELLEILPTLRVRYKDKYHCFEASDIENVTVNLYRK